MKIVTAAVAQGQTFPFTFQELELADPLPDEVVVRVVATGICHTDLAFRAVGIPLPPAVLGHEGAGIVERVGLAVTKVTAGDHVVLTYGSCGSCANCEQDRQSYCSQFQALNLLGQRPENGGATLRYPGGETVRGSFFGQSSFATYALAQQRNVVKVPTSVPLELLGPLGCGIQSGAGTVMNVLKPAAGSSIAIFGAGAVGMAAMMAAKVEGCHPIIVIDRNAERLKLALELGATECMLAGDKDVVSSIREITGDGVQFSVECTGSADVLRQAVECLRQTGECALVGLSAPGVKVELDMRMLLMGRSVRGVIEGDSPADTFIPKLIDLWEQGLFPFDRLYSFFDFTEINEAVTAVESGQVVKAVLRIQSGADQVKDSKDSEATRSNDQ